MKQILDRLAQWERIKQLDGMISGNRHVTIDGVWGGLRPFLIAHLFLRARQSAAVITETIDDAQRLYDELNAICPGQAFLFPAWEVLPSDSIPPSEDIVAERYHFIKKNIFSSFDKLILIVPVQSLVMKTVSEEFFRREVIELREGNDLKLSSFLRLLVDKGYERANMVQFRGEFAVRGGIVDVYNAVDDLPVRIELDGEIIQRIRTFDTSTQRADQVPCAASIFPKNEFHAISRASMRDIVCILDHLRDYRIYFADKERVLQKHSQIELQLKGQGAAYLALREFLKMIDRVPTADISLLARLSNDKSACSIKLPVSSYEKIKGKSRAIMEELQAQQAKGYRHVFCFHNEGEKNRLFEYWKEKKFSFSMNRVSCLYGDLREGFFIDEIAYALVTDDELFGRYKQRRARPRFPRGAPVTDMFQIKEGDYVVHVDHGIGIYQGVRKVTSDGILRDYLVILYDGGIDLLVPIEQIDLIQRYIGLERIKPKPSKLGTQGWAQTKLKVAREIRDVAADLLRVQASREMNQGIAFEPDTSWQREFEDAFIYEETEGQKEAIEEVKRDMESARPMDRLICGDVGYGKTEVAMRASFKAVMNSKQVAVLVPTTILAEQHYRTFSERMAEYPIEIACLTRFNSAEQTREILEALKSGRVDIVIGTHKLVLGDVKYADLGLVIIDEEQRFGVVHKEKFKQYRVNVDVLTLSATPIPRTLYLSLAGAKDMSMINTPPQERLPIQTFVTRFDDTIIRNAVKREINRGGQVYFVNNRVFNIEYYAKKIRRLMPGLRVGVSHGQMHGRELERVMKKFVEKEIDMLISTTIIQSGLDIPNVNTIFINRAECFGLADLYQLRGRIGRFKHRGYCYLLASEDRVITEEAAKRLRIIEEFTELGSGMKVALRDLEIRGAGNVLGVQQSGYIAQIGFELYCKLLDRTIKQMKGEEVDSGDVVLDLGVDIGIPEDYIEDGKQRLDIFRKLAGVTCQRELENIKHEIADRFGRIPDKCSLLLRTSHLRICARKKEIRYIGVEKGQLVYERKGVRKRHPASMKDLDDKDKVQKILEVLSSL